MEERDGDPGRRATDLEVARQLGNQEAQITEHSRRIDRLSEHFADLNAAVRGAIGRLEVRDAQTAEREKTLVETQANQMSATQAKCWVVGTAIALAAVVVAALELHHPGVGPVVRVVTVGR